MTPQERQLIDDLFDRLLKLEGSPRDRDAEAAIMGGLRRAPHATYALVQTVLVQDEALKRADARIQELEGHGPDAQPSGGFLDSMRGAIFGQGQSQGQPARSSVPTAGSRPTWNTGQALPPGYSQASGQGQPIGAPQPPPVPAGGGGGSFLGTAAAAAAGVVGGSLLLGSIRSMMGGGQHQAFGDPANHHGGIEDRRPWGDSGTLAKDAGADDVGSSGRGGGDYDSRNGMFDHASNEGYEDEDEIDHDSDGFDSDSDYA